MSSLRQGLLKRTMNVKTMCNGMLKGMLAGLLMLASAAQAQTTVEYVHTDALGSVVAISNSQGQVTQRREYEPYGAQQSPTPTNGPGYTGHVYDAATGLVYMQQRYYDPMVGRFLSMDPVAVDLKGAGNFNRYWYANNNPYRFADPDGRETGEAYKAIYRADGGVPNKLPMQTTAEKVIVGGTMALVAAPVLALLPDAAVAFGFSDTGAATSAALMDQTAVSAAQTAAGTAEAAGATGATSALVTTSGEVFTGASANAGGPGIATNPIVQQALNRIPSVLRACWHGACGEVNALSNALNAGAAVEGGAMATVRTVGGELMEACPTCSRLLLQLGVRAVEP